MADTKVSALTANTAPLAGDYLLQVDDPTGTPTSKRMTIGDLSIANSPVQGGLVNGYISRTVSSNNLIVAIKTIAGADPSATDPVYARIGNSVRTITAALSVTTTAGTDIYGMGGTGTLTDQDLFVYLGYRAAGPTVFIGVSRIPYGVTYANFSSTSTAVNYLNYSGSAPASTDEVENIGRFNATTSGSAAYNWSVPATSIVISRPIYETRWLDYTPTLVGWSSNPTSTAYVYQIQNRNCNLVLAQGTATTSNATTLTVTPPISANSRTNAAWQTVLNSATDNSVVKTTACKAFILASAPTTITARTDMGTGAWTNSGTKAIYLQMTYEII